MAWLHTWCGLVVGWVLFFVFVTGTAGYFHYEITRWMEPERPLQAAEPEYDNGVLALMAMERLEEVAPGAEYWNITLPHRSPATREYENFSVSWETMPLDGHEHGTYGSEDLDPATGEPSLRKEPRETAGGDTLYVMHYALHYMDYGLAYRIVGVCTMLMLMAIVTGVIAHKKIFKDFFTFRPGRGQRSWLDAHNVISVLALPFFLMITYSGLVFFATTYMPAGVAGLYGTDDESIERYFDELYEGEHSHVGLAWPEASVPNLVAQAEAAWGREQVSSIFMQHDSGGPPRIDVYRVGGGKLLWYESEVMRFHARTGERLPPEPDSNATVETTDTLLALHEGRFAEPWLRWLYFIAGLLGCGMIGTGLVLWTVKRRKRHAKAGAGFGHRLVEALNAATIAGLPAGVAAYFWANRLLPVEMADRANWEVNFIFLVWGEAFLYACFRDTQKAWVELLWLAAAAFALLPLVNVLTTDKHLGVTLPAGDWVLAGFDLTVLAIGLVFAVTAVKVRRVWLQAPAMAARADSRRLLGEAV